MNSIDISGSLKAKSDQLNADDLIGGDIVATIVDINYSEERQEQPLWLYYDGCDGKPWKPCKSMRRVIAAIWGADAALYMGRSLRLYRDENVKWAGVEVGGIRISEMSHIDKPKQLALAITKGKKQHYLVKPLKVAAPPKPAATHAPEQLQAAAEKAKRTMLAAIDAIESVEDIGDFLSANQPKLDRMKQAYPAMYDEIMAVLQMKQDRINQPFFPDVGDYDHGHEAQA